MRVVKLGHSCVRVESAGTVVVVDPGAFSEDDALDGADAVLLTHEHADHYDAAKLRRAGLPVHTHAALAEQVLADVPDLRGAVHAVAPGEAFTVGDLAVRAVGEWHAVIHDELPRVHNTGFVLDDGAATAYHPGDAFTGPGEDVDLLLLPATAPWSKVAETIDFAREVGAPHTLAIHEAIFSEPGLGVVDGHLRRFLGEDRAYHRLASGEDLTV